MTMLLHVSNFKLVTRDFPVLSWEIALASLWIGRQESGKGKFDHSLPLGWQIHRRREAEFSTSYRFMPLKRLISAK